jgi:hypothetical protein
MPTENLAQSENRMLAALPAEEYERRPAQLVPVTLELNQSFAGHSVIQKARQSVLTLSLLFVH